MGTKNNPGEFDCYAAADPDEPIFILRANDPAAPEVIRYWAYAYECRKEFENSTDAEPKPLTQSQCAKIKEALACANAMERWKKGQN